MSNVRTTGTNVIIQPIVTDDTSTEGAIVRQGKVIAVGDKVLSVSKENIVTYNPKTAPDSAHSALPYIIIDERDIFEIKVEG